MMVFIFDWYYLGKKIIKKEKGIINLKEWFMF